MDFTSVSGFHGEEGWDWEPHCQTEPPGVFFKSAVPECFRVEAMVPRQWVPVFPIDNSGPHLPILEI